MRSPVQVWSAAPPKNTTFRRVFVLPDFHSDDALSCVPVTTDARILAIPSLRSLQVWSAAPPKKHDFSSCFCFAGNPFALPCRQRLPCRFPLFFSLIIAPKSPSLTPAFYKRVFLLLIQLNLNISCLYFYSNMTLNFVGFSFSASLKQFRINVIFLSL